MFSLFLNSASKCRTLLTTILYFIIWSLFASSTTACSNGNCQVLEACSAATDCGSGLYCGNCPALGLTRPICTRGQATVPTSIVTSSFLFLSFHFMRDYAFQCEKVLEPIFHG
ncbi:hypothetical protein Ahy_B01g052789 isoform C [Arachis hypogaea]|uniref:Uncharacterized protein n=1 Tax=Arachis hypogaea TaxID=3818 RepID=A0A445AQE3_ARAHY|nr:hypothetical protein Ahy_B01g052789 isoform C [Arachis hypogaea]